MKAHLSLVSIAILVSAMAPAQVPPSMERSDVALFLPPLPPLEQDPGSVRFAALQDKRSVSFAKKPDDTFGLTYLYDGVQGFVGITLTPTGHRGKLTYNGLVVTDTTGKSLYVGAMGLYEVFRRGEWSASIGVGAKGLGLSSGFDFGATRQLVFGFTLMGRL